MFTELPAHSFPATLSISLIGAFAFLFGQHCGECGICGKKNRVNMLRRYASGAQRRIVLPPSLLPARGVRTGGSSVLPGRPSSSSKISTTCLKIAEIARCDRDQQGDALHIAFVAAALSSTVSL